MNKKIIGVSGANGAGKDVLMLFLRDKCNYLFVSATDLLGAELVKRGLPTDRKHKAELSAEWRREHGMGVIVQKAYETWQQQADKYAGVVVGSLRHPGEADVVHELGGIVVWLDADAEVRYRRITTNVREGRGSEDQVTFEEFLEHEEREMHPVGDAATLDMSSVKLRADIFMDNGGEDIAAFEKHAQTVLGIL